MLIETIGSSYILWTYTTNGLKDLISLKPKGENTSFLIVLQVEPNTKS